MTNFDASSAPKNVRRLVLDILSQRGGEIPLPVLLEQKFTELDSRDRAFCTDLASGVLRNYGRLLFLLRPYVKKPEKLPDFVLCCVLCGSYERLFRKTPEHAIVNEYAKLVKKRFGMRLCGVLNGILRSIIREQEKLIAQDAAFCSKLSEQWKNICLEYGQNDQNFFAEGQNFAGDAGQKNFLSEDVSANSLPIGGALAGNAATNTEPKGDLTDKRSVSLPNSMTADRNGVTFDAKNVENFAEIADFCGVDDFYLRHLAENKDARTVQMILWSALAMPAPCYRLSKEIEELPVSALRSKRLILQNAVRSESGAVLSVKEFNETLQDMLAAGQASRQGAASQIFCREAANFIRFFHASWLWDACCGRGGKSCGLLQEGVCVAFSSEPSETRLAAFQADCARLQLNCPLTKALPLSHAKQFLPEPAPCILLDAPCSGSGTLGRNPELRFRINSAMLSEAMELQAELLREAWTLVKTGGLLLYATCSVFSCENEQQIDRFLANNDDAELITQKLLAPWTFTELLGNNCDAVRGQDILFYAVLRKKEQ